MSLRIKESAIFREQQENNPCFTFLSLLPNLSIYSPLFPLLHLPSHSSQSPFNLLQFFLPPLEKNSRVNIAVNNHSMYWLSRLWFGSTTRATENMDSSIAQGPDDDRPASAQQFAQFGAGCFWSVELAFQRLPGVTKTEVGYSQGLLHNPSYGDVCSGTTRHSEVVRVHYDPKECSYESLLDAFWARHDPTTPNRQGNDVGTQYRSGIYYYTPEQEKAARESLEQQQKKLNRKIVTEILPAKKFYRAEEYHQQYLEKGGRFGFKQSSSKGCNDPIRCYG